MPFSRDTFLDVFAAYNSEWWPVALVLWFATLGAFVTSVTGRKINEWTFGLLAFQWAWSAVAYHAGLFSRINPAAWLFAVAFLIEAGLLLWYGVVQSSLRLSAVHSKSQIFGHALVAYGLLYPFIARLGGDSYPRVPTFGVPCPTTLVTIGFLMLISGRIPLSVIVVPLVWAGIGGSAAFLLGVPADFVLVGGGLVLATHAWRFGSLTVA